MRIVSRISQGIRLSHVQVSWFVFTALLAVSFSLIAFAGENSSGGSIFQDPDQDGLTNEEEALYHTNPNVADTDGDGYRDGAEVRSGYDPIKPAPGDKIIPNTSGSSSIDMGDFRNAPAVLGVSSEQDSTANGVGGSDDTLTNQVSDRIAEILQQSQSDGSDASLEDIQQELSKLVAEGSSNLDLPEVDVEKISVKKQNYDSLSEEERAQKIHDDTAEYVGTVSYILASNAPQTFNSSEELQSMLSVIGGGVTEALSSGDGNYLEGLAEKGQQVLDQLRDVEVPENMLDTHVKAIRIFEYATALKDQVNSSTNDPIANLLALSQAQGVLTLLLDLANDVNTKLQAANVSEIPLTFSTATSSSEE